MKILRWVIIIPYFTLATLPLLWLGMTSLKTRETAIAPTASFLPALGSDMPADRRIFAPTLDAYRRLAKPHVGTSYPFVHYLGNSVIIGLFSTLTSIARFLSPTVACSKPSSVSTISC